MWQQQMLSVAVYTKAAHGLACGCPGDQRGLMKWNEVKVQGGPHWIISLVILLLWRSWVSVKGALMVRQWVFLPSNRLMG